MPTENIATGGQRIPVQVGRIVPPREDAEPDQDQAAPEQPPAEEYADGGAVNFATDGATVGQQVTGDVYGPVFIRMGR